MFTWMKFCQDHDDDYNNDEHVENDNDDNDN